MQILCRNYSVEIENDLLEQFDFEGTLFCPIEPQLGLLVLSNKDDTFTLHIYKLLSHGKFDYHIEKELTTRKFTILVGMQFFLNTFSNYDSDEFMEFINKYDIEIH